MEERTADLLRTNEALQKEVKERTRSEQALRESEERFSYLLETIPLGGRSGASGRMERSTTGIVPAKKSMDIEPKR